MRRRLTLGLVLVLTAVLAAGCEVEKLLERGQEALQAGRYAEAVRCFEDALDRKPELGEDPQFLSRLARARAYAAEEAGRRLAAAGNWEEAAERYDAALAVLPDLAEARRARDRALREAARARHARALQAADEGNLDAARADLQRARTLDPANRDVTAALASLDAPADVDSPAAALYREGLADAGQRHWGEALATFRRAVRADANHLPARAERHRAEREVTRAREIHAEAVRLLNARSLDRAIATARRALDAWPTFPEAQSTLDQAVALRAEAHAAHSRADAAFRDGRPRDAVREAEAALSIFPAHAGARDVLARSAHALGQEAMQAGRPGSALLWFLDAGDYGTDPAYDRARRNAETQVRGRVTVRLAVGEARSDVGAAAAGRLRDGVLATLPSQAPDLVQLTSAGAEPPPAYTADLRLRELQVRTQPVAAHQRVHAYTVAREVPNPEIIRLRRLLLVERERLARLRRAWQRPCPVCGGTGRHGRGPGGPRACPHCRGTGRAGDVDRHDVERQARRVRRIEHDLARTPPTAVEHVPAEWAYTVEDHEKTARALAAVGVRRAGGVRLLDETVERAVRHEDRTIVNPNPTVGLAPDPLRFPADGALEEAALAETAPAVAERILDAVTEDFEATVRAAAEHFRNEGKTAETLEVRVDLAVWLQSRGKAEGKRLLADLRAAQRR